MSKDRVLITGASGFIGRNLSEYLQKFKSDQYCLFFPTHSELELCDPEKVNSYIADNRIDIVVHCANIGGSRKTAYDLGRNDVVANNLRMFFNIARSSYNIKRLIHLGSGAEYDQRHYKPSMSEDYFDSHVPIDPYGLSKYLCSKHIDEVGNIVNLRLFGVYGKYEDYRFKFISNAIVKNLLKLPIVINQNVNFDYLYIDDLVRIIDFFIDLANRSKYKFYNAARGKTVDLLTIANMINDISEFRSEVKIKHQGLNTEYSADNSRLLKQIEGFEFTSLEVALKQLYCWYKQNLSKIDKKAVKKDEYIKYCRVKKGNNA